jgi:protein O-mannosyl-transferase
VDVASREAPSYPIVVCAAMSKRSKNSPSRKSAGRKPDQPTVRVPRGGPSAIAAAAVLAISIATVYCWALDAPFIFDDAIGIVKNRSIVSLWPLIGTAENPGPLNTPLDNPVSARPLVNLSFAFNYFLGGLNPTGYHAASVAIHFCSALLLWALVRRSLGLPYFGNQFETSAGWLALFAAMLWALHPLQTEAVIYASQRTELMMALFYIATLYCSLRYWKSSSPTSRTTWLMLAVLACLGGMASKEVMVSAPLIVLLFERTFLAGSLAQALRRSWPLYTGLAATWLLLLYLNIGSPRGPSAGFNLGVAPHVYWLTQTKVILMYLGLVLWPWPLLIHYQLPYLTTFGESWMYVVPVLLLGLGTLALLWRNHPIGFLGTSIFAILSPTSIVPIVTEVAAERRMYLPLAPLVVLVVVGGYLVAQRVLRNRAAARLAVFGFEPPLVAVAVPALLLGIAGGAVSAHRLNTFHTPLAVWDQVLRFQPDNVVAHQNKGYLLDEAGNLSTAIDQYREAVRLAPDAVEPRANLSKLLLKAGASTEAVDHLSRLVRLAPNDVEIRNNLAGALYLCHRYDEAVTAFRATLALDPNNWVLHNNLGNTLEKAGKYQEAIESFENALRLNPGAIEIYLDIANVYSLAGQPNEERAVLQQGLERARVAGDAATADKFTARLNSAN